MEGDENKPLGSITFEGKRYTLGADWKWSGPSFLVVELLDGLFNPRSIDSPCDAVAPRGYAVVRAAAKWAKDENPELPKHPPSEPGTVH